MVVCLDAFEALGTQFHLDVFDQRHVFVARGPDEHAVGDAAFVFDVEGVAVDSFDLGVGRDVDVSFFELGGGVFV